MADKVRVAIVGLGFGAEFIPIYQAHPNAEMYAICRRNKAELDRVRRAVRRRSGVTPITTNCSKDPEDRRGAHQQPDPRSRAAGDRGAQGRQARRLHRADGTCPWTRCKQIVELQKKIGKVYMMMETVVYSREYLFAKDLYDRGVLGRIQFLRGSHQQDMDGWPDYWPGLPPMWYATHCVSPCLAILSDPAKKQAGPRRERRVPRLGPHPRRIDRQDTTARSPSRRRHSRSRAPTWSPR